MVFDSGEVSRGSISTMDVDSEEFDSNTLTGMEIQQDPSAKAEFGPRVGLDPEFRSKVKVVSSANDLDPINCPSTKNHDDSMHFENNDGVKNNSQTLDMQVYPSCTSNYLKSTSTKGNGLPEEDNGHMDYSQIDDVTAKSDDVTIKSYDEDDDDDDYESSDGETVCSEISSMKNGNESYLSQSGRSLRSRRNRRPVQEKMRQRRQTMQDMARPLKHWLYRNRANPYPNKAQKVELARSSHMTLTQVSNWFANARRRLKNTVTEPGMNWDDRVMNYNDYVKGNAELLSISSGDEEDEEEENSECGASDVTNVQLPAAATCRISVATNHYDNQRETETSPCSTTPVRWQPQPGGSVKLEEKSQMSPPEPVAVRAKTAVSNQKEGNSKSELEQKFMVTSPHECDSLLHRYLQDSWQHCPNQEEEYDRRRHQSGSLSSHDFEDMSISSRGSPIHSGYEDYPHSLEELTKYWEECADRVDDLYWKEISAALTLTSLARSKQRLGNPQ